MFLSLPADSVEAFVFLYCFLNSVVDTSFYVALELSIYPVVTRSIGK